MMKIRFFNLADQEVDDQVVTDEEEQKLGDGVAIQVDQHQYPWSAYPASKVEH